MLLMGNKPYEHVTSRNENCIKVVMIEINYVEHKILLKVIHSLELLPYEWTLNERRMEKKMRPFLPPNFHPHLSAMFATDI